MYNSFTFSLAEEICAERKTWLSFNKGSMSANGSRLGKFADDMLTASYMPETLHHLIQISWPSGKLNGCTNLSAKLHAKASLQKVLA